MRWVGRAGRARGLEISLSLSQMQVSHHRRSGTRTSRAGPARWAAVRRRRARASGRRAVGPWSSPARGSGWRTVVSVGRTSAAIGHVVEAGDGEVLGHPDAAAEGADHQAERGLVVGADHRLGGSPPSSSCVGGDHAVGLLQPDPDRLAPAACGARSRCAARNASQRSLTSGEPSGCRRRRAGGSRGRPAGGGSGSRTVRVVDPHRGVTPGRPRRPSPPPAACRRRVSSGCGRRRCRRGPPSRRPGRPARRPARRCRRGMWEAEDQHAVAGLERLGLEALDQLGEVGAGQPGEHQAERAVPAARPAPARGGWAGSRAPRSTRSTRSRSSGSTWVEPRETRETVAGETPAIAATSPNRHPTHCSQARLPLRCEKPVSGP